MLFELANLFSVGRTDCHLEPSRSTLANVTICTDQVIALQTMSGPIHSSECIRTTHFRFGQHTDGSVCFQTTYWCVNGIHIACYGFGRCLARSEHLSVYPVSKRLNMVKNGPRQHNMDVDDAQMISIGSWWHPNGKIWIWWPFTWPEVAYYGSV